MEAQSVINNIYLLPLLLLVIVWPYASLQILNQ